MNELEIQRETAKYDAVRALIVHLVARKSCTEPIAHTGTTSNLPDITDEQAMELLKTNARLRAIFQNNVAKTNARELKENERLIQIIADKDAEIAGMLRSLA